MSVTLLPGDCRDSLRRMAAEGTRVHAVVTDPPYGLESIQKRFGKKDAAPARTDNNDGSFARLSKGFMQKIWDGTGIERDPDFWRLVFDVLLPGGYVFAFGGARTGHWLACAMEQAGFTMHPMHGWVYGQGFPKAHAADKAIDKHLGTRGETGPDGYVAATPEAEQWEGWAYGTQAQKPALEPIFLGQRPFSEKTGAANLLKHGVGAVNIDGCRVPTEDNLNGGAYAETGNRGESPAMHGGTGMNVPGKTVGAPFVQPEGRHPANLLHDGSPEVLAMFPDSTGSGAARTLRRGQRGESGWGMNSTGEGEAPLRDAGTGSAARFFNSFPIHYAAKAGKEDRAGSKHPTVKPVALLQHLIRHITPEGGTVLDPFAGSGTTGEAALREGVNCILMEAEPEYVDFLRERFDLPEDVDALLDDLLAEDLI